MAHSLAEQVHPAQLSGGVQFGGVQFGGVQFGAQF